MELFIKKICLAIALIAGLYILSGLAFYSFVGNQYSTGYPGALLDKIDRLNSINEPKIILVGDSNVAFGFRSKIIEDNIGMPVVNLGMQHDLGNAFNERLALLNLNEGDIVILCNMDYQGDNRFISTELAWSYLEWNPSVWKNVKIEDCWDLLKGYPTYLRDAYKRHKTGAGSIYEDSAYCRYSFNEYGDNIYSVDHYMQGGAGAEDLRVSALMPPTEDSVIRINRMNELINQKGATLLVAGKPLVATEPGEATENFLAVCEAYDYHLNSVLDCAVISSSASYIYPSELYYDGYPHLNNEGAELRSWQLVYDLQLYLNSKEAE